MASFNVPASPTQYEVNLDGFLGVDFSSSMSDIDKRRCPKGYNFINNNGTIEKRNGYKVLAYLGENANINGVWNVDTIEGEFFIVHCGTKLYEMQTDFSSYTVIMTGLADTISQGIIINSKLLILDGKRAIIYDLLLENDRVGYLDEKGYIPITHIARSPDGTQDQLYESVNLLQSSRINQFISNNTDKVYQLADTGISLPVLVEVMNENGEYETKVRDQDYTVDFTNGKITFEKPVGNPPVTGRDNVRIKYNVSNFPEKSQVNKCNMAIAYGYAGANNRVFITGNPDFPNIVMYSEFDDITYIAVENVQRIGLATAEITGFARLNSGKLAVLKNVSDTDSTIFYIGYANYNGKEVFPLEGSTKGEGNIGNHSNDTLVNEPLILTRNGVFALNSATINDERFTYHRSYYIDTYLLKEPNLEKAVGIANDGKYYLAINNNVYVADSRIKSTTKNGRYSNYQYEWYFWTNLPIRIWFLWNGKLYFGDKYGNLCCFRDNNDKNRYKDNESNVISYWSTPILDLGQTPRKKTIRRVVVTSNPSNSQLTIGYILKNGEKQVMDKTYINSTFPKKTVIRKKAKRLSFISIYVENEGINNMSFNSLTVVYTVGSFYKGD